MRLIDTNNKEVKKGDRIQHNTGPWFTLVEVSDGGTTVRVRREGARPSEESQVFYLWAFGLTCRK